MLYIANVALFQLHQQIIVVKIRDWQVTNRPIYVATGVTVNGERDILGWRQLAMAASSSRRRGPGSG